MPPPSESTRWSIRLPLLLAMAAMGGSASAAEQPALREVGRVKATLPPFRDVRPLAGGRFVRAWDKPTRCPQAGWTLVDLTKAERIELCVPKRAVPEGAELIFFSPERDEVGLLIKELIQGRGRFQQRTSYSAWQLSREEEAYRIVVDEAEGEDTPEADYIITSYGADPSERFHYFFTFRPRRPKKGTHIELIQLDRSTQTIRTRYSVDSDWNESAPPFLQASPDFTLFAIAEYSERGYGKAPMFIVHVLWEKHIELEAPFAPYGMAFDPEQRHLVVGSNYGQLHLYDVRKGKKLRIVDTAKPLHSVVLSQDSRWLYVFPRGKQAIVHAWPTIERIGKISARAVRGVGGAFAGDALIAGANDRLLVPSADKMGFPKDGAPLVILEIIDQSRWPTKR